MQVKMLEIRDAGTFVPVMCIRPLPDNEGQRYLLNSQGRFVGILPPRGAKQ